MATAIAEVPGVVGVVLGGSRARGDALPGSDVDLGLYCSGPPDVEELSRLASRWSGDEVRVGEPGSWGPWVDAGAWLTVDGVAVDWIVRDLARVRRQWDRACRGEYAFHAQAGHPLGFLDVAYAGELATSRVLADPSGQLTALRAQVTAYPTALRDAMVGGLWEAGFLVSVARKGAARGDTTYVALCVSRALMIAAHALHAEEGRWVTNEKGLVPAAGSLPGAPSDFAERAAAALSLGSTPEALVTSIAVAADLVREVEHAVSNDAD
jgi:predicted nucleotidyltransferase